MNGPRVPFFTLPANPSGFVLGRILGDIKKALDYAADRHDYSRILLKDVSLTTGAVNKVLHGLGQIPTGWRVTRINAAATVHETTADTDATYLHLNVSANCTASLEVW